MKHIHHYAQIYTPLEIQLANEIAQRLQDPASLTQFLKMTKELPNEILRNFLNKACSVPDGMVRSSRAAIFVNSVNKYRTYGNGYPGN